MDKESHRERPYRFTVAPIELRHVETLLRRKFAFERIAKIKSLPVRTLHRDLAMLQLADILHDLKLESRIH